MINHFKAEFYKLRHSKILITILGVCAAVIMVSFALGDMTFFGAGDGTESVIGFQAKCYLSSEIPTFQTVARSSLAYTAFFWIIGILFATIFFTKEYNTGTIKLSVAYGTKRTILYYTKAITILVVSLITYLIFVATFFVIEIIQSGYIPTASEVINLLGWALACGTVLLALESISIFLCVVIQNTGIVTGICCLYVFSGASVYLMLWSDMETVSIPLKFFVYGNPMYYWMNFSSCRTMGIIEHLPFYFIGCISLLIVGGLIMIIQNLIFNAVTSTTNNVVIQLINIADSVQLCIKNPVASIPTEEYSKLLERFYVADVSRSNGTSGQGLYIVKKLLLMMNCTNPIIEIHDHNFMITIDFSPLLIKK